MLSLPAGALLALAIATSLLGLAPGTRATVLAKHAHRVRHHHRHRVRPAAGSTTASSTGRCLDADTPATAATASVMRAAVVCLVNQERTSRGLTPLQANPDLNTSAQKWTDQMVATGDFTHGPGDSFAGRISAAGYVWQAAGENIATGYSTPRQVVRAWMASPDHCQNILDPTYRDVGTGVDPAPVGSWASGPSTWTQDFGLQMGATPPSSDHTPMNGCPYSS